MQVLKKAILAVALVASAVAFLHVPAASALDESKAAPDIPNLTKAEAEARIKYIIDAHLPYDKSLQSGLDCSGFVDLAWAVGHPPSGPTWVGRYVSGDYAAGRVPYTWNLGKDKDVLTRDVRQSLADPLYMSAFSNAGHIGMIAGIDLAAGIVTTYESRGAGSGPNIYRRSIADFRAGNWTITLRRWGFDQYRGHWTDWKSYAVFTGGDQVVTSATTGATAYIYSLVGPNGTLANPTLLGNVFDTNLCGLGGQAYPNISPVRCGYFIRGAGLASMTDLYATLRWAAATRACLTTYIDPLSGRTSFALSAKGTALCGG